MNDQQNPPPIPVLKEVKKKRLWPWVLLQFLPTVAITVVLLLQLAPRRRAGASDWLLILCGLVFLYGYTLCFFFFRSRNKTVSYSLLVSIAAALVVIAANVILILGIVFVGCLVIVGKQMR